MCEFSFNYAKCNNLSRIINGAGVIMLIVIVVIIVFIFYCRAKITGNDAQVYIVHTSLSRTFLFYLIFFYFNPN